MNSLFQVGPVHVHRTFIAAFIAATLLTTVHAGFAQTEPPVIENGFKGTMETPPDLALKATLGEEGPDEALLYSPVGILFGPSGDVFITDRGNCAIQVYDRNGRFKYRIGRRGSGPGELQIQGMPPRVYFAWNGELVVCDWGNRRTSYFSPKGVYLRSEPLSDDEYSREYNRINKDQIPTQRGEYLRAGRLREVDISVTGQVSGRQSGPENSKLFEIVNDTGDVVRSFGALKQFNDRRFEILMNRPMIAYNAATGKIAVAYPHFPEISVFDEVSGELKCVITREQAFTPREPGMKERRITSPDGRSVRVNRELDADTINFDVAYDCKGRLWVLTLLVDNDERRRRQEEEDYDKMIRLEVFSPQGVLQCGIPLKDPAVSLAFDAAGDLWLMDRTYNLSVRRYEVIWP